MAVRSELRNRWREWLALTLLVALLAGAIIAVAAGARRTDSAYQRFLTQTRAPDALVFGARGPGSTFAQFSAAQLASLYGVAHSGQLLAFEVTRPADVELGAPTDTTIGTAFWTKKLIAGRFANPSRANEVTISFALADADHLGVGDKLRLHLESASSTRAVPVTLHIVGIDAAASEFPPSSGTGIHMAWATPAFARTYGRSLLSVRTTALQLRGGAAGLHAVMSELATEAGGRPIQTFALRDQSNNTQRSIHLEAVALWILAGLLAVVALLILTQLLVRQSWLDVDSMRQMHLIGMSRRQLWCVGMLRVGLIALVAATAAVVIAIAASPVFPIGLAGVAEPHPGLSIDAWALALGAAGMVCVLVACGALPNWWAARIAAAPSTRYQTVHRPSRLVVAMTRWNAPVSATTGVAWAVQAGRERTAAPVRTTIAITVVGLAALTGAFVFSSSLGHLVDTPPLYGVTWDSAVVSSLGEGTDMGGALTVLRADPAVSAISEGYAGVPVQIGDTRVEGIAMNPISGPSLMPRVVAGRLPAHLNEVMLGSETMAATHAHIGSILRVAFAGLPASHPVRVVGQGVFPTLADTLGLGQGVALTTGTLLATIPPGRAPPPDTILVRFHEGTDPAAAVGHLGAAVARMGPYDAVGPQQPTDLVNFGRVSALPLAVGVLLTIVAVAALGHLLVTAIRRRRIELATLRVIGFLPRQLQAAIASQASTTALVALLFGVPLGIALGRGVWYVFAHQLGVVIVPVVPWAAIAIEIAAALVLANLLALVPARRVARMHPATDLRTP